VNVDVGGLAWRRAVAIVALLLVWMVFVAALATIGWYVWSDFVDPPHRDPAAVGAATVVVGAASRRVDTDV
jgi:hypothetical protein